MGSRSSWRRTPRRPTSIARRAKGYLAKNRESVDWALEVDHNIEIAGLYRQAGQLDSSLGVCREVLDFLVGHDPPAAFAPIVRTMCSQRELYSVPVAIAETLRAKGDAAAALTDLQQVAEALASQEIRDHMITPLPAEEASPAQQRWHTHDLLLVEYLQKADLPIRLGRCYMQLGQYGAAVKEFDSARRALLDAASLQHFQNAARCMLMFDIDSHARQLDLARLRDEELPVLIRECQGKLTGAQP